MVNLASVGKVVAGAVKSSNMGKIVYSTGGNKGTFFDAFKAYQSQKGSVRRLAQDIFQRAEKVTPEAKETFEPLSKGLGIFGQRTKKVKKMTGKISKALTKISDDDLMELIRKGQMHNIIGDAYGSRVILNDLGNTEKFMARLLKKHDAGKIKILGVENYHGKRIKPYLDDKILSRIAQHEGISVANTVREAGYTRVNIDILVNGLKTELQLGGKYTTRFGEIEHYLYDMRGHGNVDVSKLNFFQKSIFSKMKNEYVKLCKDSSKNAEYQKYLTKIWKTLKKAEEKNLPFPKLPKPSKGIPEILSAENLFKLEKNVNL